MLDPGTVFRIVSEAEIFASVSRDEIEALIARSAQRELAPPLSIFEQGESPDAVYIVLCGEVWIVSISLEGNSLFHVQLGPGELFGEIAVLDAGPRTSGATVNRPCEVLAIPAEHFVQLVERNAAVALHVARRLARRIRHTSQGLEDAVFLSARVRVAKKLVELARAHGRERPPGVLLENVTHETLANMIGLHRVTVTNQIASLERDGLVRSERARLVLLDLARLEKLCSEPPPATRR